MPQAPKDSHAAAANANAALTPALAHKEKDNDAKSAAGSANPQAPA
jgi:hypothetical protein